jgi:GT2 family glycosyltransferase
LEALKKNTLASESILYIFADGPKKDAQDIERERIIKTRTVLTYDQWAKEIIISESAQNKGLAASIIDGVSYVVKKHGSIIVLEDDIVTSKYFLQYMNDALKRYENEQKVWHITGFSLPVNKKGLAETYFTRFMGCWGWGTWKNRWEHFRKDSDELLCLFSKSMKFEFNYGKGNSFWGQIEQNKAGAINTWAIYWYGVIYINQGLCLNPREAFAKNIGMDGSGVHCEATKAYEVKLSDKYPVIFEERIEELKQTRKKLQRYFSVKVNEIMIIMIENILKRIKKEGVFNAIGYYWKKYRKL